MANLLVKDGTGSVKYLSTTGAGTDGDPHVPQQVVNVSNTAFDVNVQDRASSTLILPMVQQLGLSTLTSEAVIDTYTVDVVSSAGATIGNHIRIINSAADRYYFGRILNIVGNTITVDNPIDFEYIVGSEATFSNQNLNVNGSGTPVVFKLRTGSPSIPSTIHITRLIITCECTDSVALDLFGDLPALTRGLVFRSTNGDIRNIFNIKKNGDMSNIGYDFVEYSSTFFGAGQDGFAWRLSFNGDDKMGTVLKVLQDGNLEMLVQDNLTGLTELRVVLEGHVEVDTA